MTVKQFFKSTAFKSIAVLMAIVIVAGALLTVLNFLLEVSEDERDARTMPKNYTLENISGEPILGSSDQPITIDGNDIERVFLMDDNNYLIKVTGNKGAYSGGSITVWVTMECTGTKAAGNLVWKGIKSVDYASNEKQSYIGRLTEADYAQFSASNSLVLDGKLFDEGINVIKTGASAPFTMSALTGAVNSAITYFKQEIIGITEKDIYEYQSWIDLDNSTITPNIDENSVTYQLTVKKNSPAPSFIVNITVTDGKITAYTHEGDYFIPGNEDYEHLVDSTILDHSFFIGMTKEDILAIVKEDGGTLSSGDLGSLSTGATRSTESFLYAAAYALVNYKIYIAKEGGTQA